MSNLSNRTKSLLLVAILTGLFVLAAIIFAISVQGAEPSAPARCEDSPTVCFIRKYFDGPDDEALRVAHCESRYDPRAQRPGSQFIGVFQIGSDIHAQRVRDLGYTTDDLRDAGKNAAVAWSLYRDSGHSWSHWECQP